MSDSEKPFDLAAAFGLPGGAKDKDRLREAADQYRVEMERCASVIRDTVVSQPPLKLLGFLLAKFHVSLLEGRESKDGYVSPNKEVLSRFQMILEYVHAAWSCTNQLQSEELDLDESVMDTLMNAFNALEMATMFYCMTSSASKDAEDSAFNSTDVEFQAKSTWTLIRGSRYQALEEEFFLHVLSPHEEALKLAYGVDHRSIASGIQKIADRFRLGTDRAFNLIKKYFRVSNLFPHSISELIKAMSDFAVTEENDKDEITDAISDLFYGGICNMSRHSQLPIALLSDLSYEPGQNREFFEPGEFCGTPMRTLPARIRPGVLIGDEFYTIDGQFIRDAAYRAIQRGIRERLPYRDEWLRRQGILLETSFTTIFAHQLAKSKKIYSAYYRDVDTGRWVETDAIIMLDDVMFVIEAKANALPMHSPALNFESHERVIKNILVRAYEQCARMLKYLNSVTEAPIYELRGGDHVEIARIKLSSFRRVFPIGLTMESFTPFLTTVKELEPIKNINGRYPFIAVSIDDLFVLSRMLKNTGELLHYFEVRQNVAAIKDAFLWDELDHLGAYISRNRFDQDLARQLTGADRVAWDSFSDIIDDYFGKVDWDSKPIPTQKYPSKLREVLDALDHCRPAKWLAADSFLRDFEGSTRENIARLIKELEKTLDRQSSRKFDISGHETLQIWVCRAGSEPSTDELIEEAQISCLAWRTKIALVIIISYKNPNTIAYIKVEWIRAPAVLQMNYHRLVQKAVGRAKKTKRI